MEALRFKSAEAVSLKHVPDYSYKLPGLDFCTKPAEAACVVLHVRAPRLGVLGILLAPRLACLSILLAPRLAVLGILLGPRLAILSILSTMSTFICLMTTLVGAVLIPDIVLPSLLAGLIPITSICRRLPPGLFNTMAQQREINLWKT